MSKLRHACLVFAALVLLTAATAAAAPPSWCQTTTPPAPSKTTTVGPTTFTSSISCVPAGYQDKTRTLQITNNTAGNVWFAGFGTAISLNSASNPGNYLPVGCTGFYVQASKSVTLTLPYDLSSARFWPRVGCVEATEYAAYTPPAGTTESKTYYCKYDYLACDTGTCSPAASWQTEYGANLSASGDPKNWAACYLTTGVSPQSLFEVTFGTNGASDYYDLSNVDGFGAALTMNVTGNYSRVSGLADPYNCNSGDPSSNPPKTPTPAVCLNFDPSTMCPAELQVSDGGSVIGCMSIGAAAASPTQGPILAKAWSSRTDALNANFVTSVKRAISNGASGPAKLNTVADLVMPGNTGIYPAVTTALSCGCGNPATGCGFTKCDAGCSPDANYQTGTCYPWPAGVDATNNSTGSVNCTTANNPQNPTCKAAPSSCFVWNSANETQNQASQCKSSWWPTPDKAFCSAAKSWLGSNPCRYDTIFKAPCPDAYSWQFDDLNSTFQCLGADYVVTVETTK